MSASGQFSSAMRSPVAVCTSKLVLGEVTFSITSRMPHWRKRSSDEGRRPMPAPTSWISDACSYTLTVAPRLLSALAAAAPA